MYDLAIVGGGFWGTACALRAIQQGLDVLLIDDANPEGASRNSAGIACLHWYKQETIKRMWPVEWSFREVEDSFQWLKDNCGLEKTGERFRNMSSGVEKFREDCYLIGDNSSLLKLAIPHIQKIEKVYAADSSWVLWSNKEHIEAKKIIIAAGAYTDTLLENSGFSPVGVKPLFGRAMVVEQDGIEIESPLTVLVRPYVHFTLRPWLGKLRWGDTTERKPIGPYVYELEKAFLNATGRVPKVADWAQGVRPVCSTMTVKRIAPNAIVAVGGHRVGLGISGLVANRALDLLS